MYMIFSIIAILFIVSCGFEPDKKNIGANELAISELIIEKGKTSEELIFRTLGPPSINNPFKDNVVYYISQNMQKDIGKDFELREFILLKIEFNQNKIVQNYEIKNQSNIENIEINELRDSDVFNKRTNYNLMKNLLDNMRRKNKID